MLALTTTAEGQTAALRPVPFTHTHALLHARAETPRPLKQLEEQQPLQSPARAQPFLTQRVKSRATSFPGLSRLSQSRRDIEVTRPHSVHAGQSERELRQRALLMERPSHVVYEKLKLMQFFRVRKRKRRTSAEIKIRAPLKDTFSHFRFPFSTKCPLN